MITAVPWPELVKTARRIIRSGCEGRWVAGSAENEANAIPVRCYATSNLLFATLVADRGDLPSLLAGAGRFVIHSSGDETLVLRFRPRLATLLSKQLNGGAFTPDLSKADYRRFGSDSEPVLVFGSIEALELHVPSHSIDVIAPLRQLLRVPAMMGVFGLN
jgi:hypothetical protein